MILQHSYVLNINNKNLFKQIEFLTKLVGIIKLMSNQWHIYY